MINLLIVALLGISIYDIANYANEKINDTQNFPWLAILIFIIIIGYLIWLFIGNNRKRKIDKLEVKVKKEELKEQKEIKEGNL